MEKEKFETIQVKTSTKKKLTEYAKKCAGLKNYEIIEALVCFAESQDVIFKKGTTVIKVSGAIKTKDGKVIE
jgi:flagellar hook assembly protein FlgD